MRHLTPTIYPPPLANYPQSSKIYPMYYSYFGLKEAPFSIAPNPHYLLMTEQHQEALAHLYHGIGSDAGFVLLTGEVGTGKTTVCRQFLQLLPQNTQPAIILNPTLNELELLQAICQELQIAPVEDRYSLRQLSDSIYQHLLSNHSQGINTVLLIDEAQHIGRGVLEQIRLLTNLETDKQKLLKIILVGQPELNLLLAQPELVQLSQRITARFHIHPLSVAEVTGYIQHRLQTAGYQGSKRLFSSAAIRKLFQLSQGVPRLVNVLCDRALLGAYATHRRQIGVSLVCQAHKEVQGNYTLPSKSGAWRWALPATLCVCLAVGYLFQPTLRASVGNSWLGDWVDNWAGAYLYSDLHKDLPAPAAYGAESDSSVEPAPEVATSQVIDEVDALLGKHSVLADTSVAPAADKPQVDIERVDRQVEPPIAFNPGDYFSDIDKAKRFMLEQLAVRLALDTKALDDERACGSWRCDKAEVFSWSGFKKYNRPSLMHLEYQDESYYVPVIAISDTHVLVVGEADLSLSLTELGQYWAGEFTFFWHGPDDFDRLIYKRTSASGITWLAERFARLDQRDEPLADGRYNSLLEKRVSLFQSRYSLKEDGKAGVETLLKLNEQLDEAVTLNSITGWGEVH